MSNPNDCQRCSYRQNTPRQQWGGSDGWCYMFKKEPNEVCRQFNSVLGDALLQARVRYLNRIKDNY